MADAPKVPETPVNVAPAKEVEVPLKNPMAPPTPKPNVITSANLPKAVAPGQTTAPPDSQVAATPPPVDDSDIVARPLVSPDFTNIKPSNPAMSLRFVNRLAQGGQRFEEAKIQGFIVCKPSDIKEIPNTMTVKDNCVTYGDVIAMMMPRAMYLGAIKYNEEVARSRVRRQTVVGEAQGHLAAALNEVPGSRADKSKIKIFTPDR